MCYTYTYGTPLTVSTKLNYQWFTLGFVSHIHFHFVHLPIRSAGDVQFGFIENDAILMWGTELAVFKQLQSRDVSRRGDVYSDL